MATIFFGVLMVGAKARAGTVPPIGTILTNVAPSLGGKLGTNYYEVVGVPVLRNAHVATPDVEFRKFGIGEGDIASGTLIQDLPGEYNVALEVSGVVQLKGTSTRANKVPNNIAEIYPQFCPLNTFQDSGSQQVGDAASGRSLLPARIDGPGVIFSQIVGEIFSFSIDCTNPDLLQRAGLENFFLEGKSLVLSLATDGTPGVVTTRIVGSSAAASDSAHGVFKSITGGSGFTETATPYLQNPMYNVCVGGVFLPLRKLSSVPYQTVTLTLAKKVDGTEILFSESLHHPAFLEQTFDFHMWTAVSEVPVNATNVFLGDGVLLPLASFYRLVPFKNSEPLNRVMR